MCKTLQFFCILLHIPMCKTLQFFCSLLHTNNNYIYNNTYIYNTLMHFLFCLFCSSNFVLYFLLYLFLLFLLCFAEYSSISFHSSLNIKCLRHFILYCFFVIWISGNAIILFCFLLIVSCRSFLFTLFNLVYGELFYFNCYSCC